MAEIAAVRFFPACSLSGRGFQKTLKCGTGRGPGVGEDFLRF